MSARPAGPPRVGARRVAAVAVAGLLAAGATLLGSGTAAASDLEDEIVRYDMTITLDDEGRADVVLDLDMDFGAYPNHGPYLTWIVKERYDDTQDRVYRIRDFRVSSETAPTPVDTEEISRHQQAATAYRIGDEDITITGVHSYRITFRAEGWVNSAGYAFPDGRLTQDELYLNVIDSWDLPIRDVSIEVIGPDGVADAACFVDRTSDAGCDRVQVDGSTAEFRQAGLSIRQPLTIAIAYPGGTFGGAEPILQERWAIDRAFAVNPATGALAVLIGAASIVGVVRMARRRGRDEQFLGLTPGLTPTNADAAVGSRRKGPVAVRFSPPEGFRPGQIGTLVDEKADPHDVTATIIDLAVRQYLRIVRLPDPDGRGDGDWRLDQSDKPTDDLLPFERLLLDELFSGRHSVTLEDLKTTFATSMARVQDDLYRDVTARGWFRGNPKKARNAWAGKGVLALLGAIGVTVLLAIWTSWALLGVGLIIAAIVMLTLTGSAPARTARGSAVLVQAEGFRRYLATAEANQLRFEEGEDLFSRYLPYAVAFELTERWANLFAQLAAQGRALPEPTWYIGPYHGVAFWGMAGTLGRDLSQLTDATEAALSTPAPGSSGSSGFGGGGFGGGGVGGGGGGSW